MTLTLKDVILKSESKDSYSYFLSNIFIIDKESKDTIHTLNIPLKIEEKKEGEFDMFLKLTSGNPLKSKTYEFYIELKTNKGIDKASVKFDVDLISNPNIKITKQEITAEEIIIFSKQKQKIITSKNEKIYLNEEIAIFLMGLEGFNVIDRKCGIDMKIKITDAKNQVLIEKQVQGENTAEKIKNNPSILELKLTDVKNYVNPCKLIFTVKDLNGTNELRAETELKIVRKNIWDVL